MATRASLAPNARRRRGRATRTASRPSGWRRCRWCGCGCARMSSPRGSAAGTRRAAPDRAHVLQAPCTRHACAMHTPCKRRAFVTQHRRPRTSCSTCCTSRSRPRATCLSRAGCYSPRPTSPPRRGATRVGSSSAWARVPVRATRPRGQPPQREAGDVCRRPAACTRLPSGAAVSRALASCGSQRGAAARLDAQTGRRFHVGTF